MRTCYRAVCVGSLPRELPRSQRKGYPTSKYLIVLALGLAIAGVSPAAASTTYTLTDLGSLGYGVTYGLAINANGQITGYSYLSTEIQVTCPPQQYGGTKKCFIHPYHAFLYSNGTMKDLGTLGGTKSKGLAINLSGEVVGSADLKTGFSDSFLWNGGKTMTDIGSWNAAGINDSGQISGGCQQACIYNNGTFTQLPNPSGLNCNGGPINNNGDMIGGCTDSTSNATSKQYVVLWQNGTPTDLGNLGGPEIRATALNNVGQVTGFGQTSTDANHGFLWSNGTMTDLGLDFYPNAVNVHGVIVGGSNIDIGGTFQNVNNLIPPGSGFTLDDATGINDNGQIVVNGYNAQGQEHAFLLTPG